MRLAAAPLLYRFLLKTVFGKFSISPRFRKRGKSPDRAEPAYYKPNEVVQEYSYDDILLNERIVSDLAYHYHEKDAWE